MKLKVQVNDEGSAYVAAIDPETSEHRKAVTVDKGQEVDIDLGSATEDELSFGEVVATPAAAPTPEVEDPAPEGEPPPPGGEGDQPPAPPAEDPPTTSAVSEKPLYLVDGMVPVGFELSGLETPDAKPLWHFDGDAAGEPATGNADSVSVYANADENDKPVQVPPAV